MWLFDLYKRSYTVAHQTFNPVLHSRMSWPGGQLGGARTLLDNRGRRIFFDWVREFRGLERERASGWSGVMSLPRILDLAADGSLLIKPVPELEVLRANFRRRRNLELAAGAEVAVDEVRGDCLELALEIQAGTASEFGVKVRCAPDGAEQTAIVCDAAAGKLEVDIGRSSLDDEIQYPYYRTARAGRKALDQLPEKVQLVEAQEAPFALAPGESLKLRIYLDRSVLEVFANERQCITQRIYPTRSDSLGVRLFARGGAALCRTFEAWDMAPAHI